MVKLKVRQTHSFKKATQMLLAKAPSDWDYLPSEEFSSERMGGWIMKDSANMYIGWVGNLGDVTHAGYRETTPAHKFNNKGHCLNQWEDK